MDENTDNISEGGLTDSAVSGATTAGGVELPVFLDIDEVFEALDHFRRRYLVFSLLVEDKPVSLANAAMELYAWEQSVPLDAVEEDDLTALSAALYHVHVPKLRELGIVTYDEDERAVECGQNTAHVASLIHDSSSFQQVENAHDHYNTEADHDAN
jgi:hypothetical protein